jgi:uncharacterized protein (TIGR00661 family)
MPEKNVVFAVQGEGRGHLTQAIALFQFLREQGYTISCVIVGFEAEREIPGFFLKKIDAPIVRMESPKFHFDRDTGSVNLSRTVLNNLARWKTFLRSISTMRDVIRRYDPQILINFYEPLVALYVLRYPPNFRIISVAHQYTYLHEAFRFPRGKYVQSMILKWYTAFTALGSERTIALSMYQLPRSYNNKLLVCPPLLRENLFTKTASEGSFILVYLVKSAYITDVIRWHRKHPDTRLDVFTDNRDVRERHKGLYRFDETLSFHSLSDERFLDMMSQCSALVCTAGFESVCEAMYLGKPVMMMPVRGQFEQYCNAWDTERIGAGIFSESFDPDRLANRGMSPCDYDRYREWVQSSRQFLVSVFDELEEKAGHIPEPLFWIPRIRYSFRLP